MATNVFLDSDWEKFMLAQAGVYSQWAVWKQVKENHVATVLFANGDGKMGLFKGW